MAKTIRLLSPILSEGVFIKAGSVLDATNDSADFLLNSDPPHAELTDAPERHHAVKLLHSITAVPAKDAAPAKAKAAPSKDKP